MSDILPKREGLAVRKENHTTPPSLLVSREEAAQKIRAQIEKAPVIDLTSVRSFDDLDKARSALRRWSDYNVELLTCLFDNPSMAQEYGRPTQTAFIVERGRPNLALRVGELRKSLNTYVSRLQSIVERLELIPVVGQVDSSAAHVTSERGAPHNRDVFVVHGHDEAARESVARLIENLGSMP